MVKADILRGPQATQYAFIHARHQHPTLKTLAFNDLYSCVSFLRRFDASTHTWLSMAKAQDGFSDWLSNHRNSAIEEFIAGLILRNRVRVCCVNTHIVTLAAPSNNPLASILGFIDPSAVLVRHIIKQWSFTQASEVNAALNRLNLQASELQALHAAFKVPLQDGPNRLAALGERILNGTLLLVTLPRAGKVALEHSAAEPSPARFTTPPASSLQRSVPAPLALVPKVPVAAQVQALKQAATSGAALCEKCTPKANASSVPTATPAAPRQPASAQARALIEAAANGQAFCERCPTPAARAAAS